eukprot:CAMPEP_0174376762 /NCGR_PEP_ID=MMETSP0811_2-20130205/119388_1 /TAXON_ID=73025 ORGANISM="Eutreptiella gymnastica-like, Strain CCMP1594" /NCGR_SAMPLE_ID=MMETSP0811_2 /ASSEMBLY_ACC=CAM_ASM_000667 /LENGTH=76 /DNA_ID=CAMNT_0015528279 /DNA_START=423 /DNA_END=649 /DNA_ORIENTATION=-
MSGAWAYDWGNPRTLNPDPPLQEHGTGHKRGRRSVTARAIPEASLVAGHALPEYHPLRNGPVAVQQSRSSKSGDST